MSEIVKIKNKNYLRVIKTVYADSSTKKEKRKENINKVEELGVIVGDEIVKDFHKGLFYGLSWVLLEVEFLVPMDKLKEFNKINW